MKTTKIILSAFVAAIALVSCNKHEATPDVVNANPNTVEVKINNVFMTKSPGALLEPGQIQLNKVNIFLTDGQSVYNTAKNASGETLEASAYELTSVANTISYHFVDPKVTKVVAVANYEFTETISTYAQLQALTLDIAKQQSEANLALYAEAQLESAGTQHIPSATEHEGQLTNLYEANLNLAPKVSRFELDGFAVKFFADETKALYNKVTINQVAFNNYYPTANLSSGITEGTVVDCKAESAADAIAYLTANASSTVSPAPWYFEKFTGVVLERPAAMTADTWVEAEAVPSYYHAFAGTYTAEQAGYPELMFQISTEDKNGDVSSTYIYTKSLKDANGTAITTFEPGKIYRMNFSASVESDNGEGDVPIEEDDIKQLGRCLDITVTVADWSVVLVTPEF